MVLSFHYGAVIVYKKQYFLIDATCFRDLGLNYRFEFYFPCFIDHHDQHYLQFPPGIVKLGDTKISPHKNSSIAHAANLLLPTVRWIDFYPFFIIINSRSPVSELDFVDRISPSNIVGVNNGIINGIACKRTPESI